MALEYEMVTQPTLASSIRSQFQGQTVILYERVMRLKSMVLHKNESLWNFNVNVASKSLKGILLLFKEAETAFAHDPEKFYNPQIKKCTVTIDGLSNQIYANGLQKISTL